MHWKAPFRLVSSTVSQSDSFMVSIRPSRVTPALFTRMSTRPNRARTSFTMASQAAASATSAWMAKASAPRSWQAFTVSSAAAALPA